MNCDHVLDLIDAGPFADVPAAQAEAARRHARGCATCGPALEAAMTVAADLAGLSQPAPPPDLAAAVMARIHRIDYEALPSHEVSGVSAMARARDWAAWMSLLVGFLLIAGVVAVGPFAAAFRMAGVLGGLWDLATAGAALHTIVGATLLLALGVSLYALGLFAAGGGSAPRRVRTHSR